jgi:hypothetical protein
MQNQIGRRSFLGGSLAAACAIGAASTHTLAGEPGPAAGAREIYELRIYQLDDKLFPRAHNYFEKALIPAIRRAGGGPTGVFEEAKRSDKAPLPSLYVLATYPSCNLAVMLPTRLEADAQYQQAGAEFLKAPPTDPSYASFESRLMLAADFMPKIETPEKKDTRLFELRIYRSPSEPAFRKKLEMFSPVGGELRIFRRVGLAPVFFAEMLFGPSQPNLTYMLTYPDAAARPQAWKTFGADPEWQKLRATPGYTDPELIARGGITSTMLKPTAYSEI